VDSSWWSRSATELLIAYVIVAVGLALGLHHRHAPRRTLFSTPVIALPLTIIALLAWAVVLRVIERFWWPPKLWIQALSASVVFVGIGYGAGVIRSRQARSAVTRGTRLASMIRPLRKPAADNVTFAGVPVPVMDETKHFKLIGTTGTGKSTAIRELLRGALARGDRAVSPTRTADTCPSSIGQPGAT
jgi:hypothetical protein